jgi:hypothetical protein
MKRKKNVKKTQKPVDKVDDQVVNEDAVPYITRGSRGKKKEEDDDDLTEEQLKQLDEAIDEAKRGETISFEEFRKSMDRWSTKLSLRV